MIENKSINLTFTSLPDISQTPFGKDVKKYQVLQNKRVMKWQEQLKMMVL